MRFKTITNIKGKLPYLLEYYKNNFEFVDENIPWAHIDIGGTSTTQKTNGYWVKGATGVGVATLVQLVKGR